MIDEVWVDARRAAAVVYDVGVAVDHLLLVFAEDLAADGVRIGGIVQVPPTEPGCGPRTPMQLRDLATGEVFSPCQGVGPSAVDCRLDPAIVQQAAQRIRAATETASDVIFVPRFGKAEAREEGFRDEIAHAVLRGRRVLMAVPRGLTDSWLSVTGGIGTLLDARLWVLKDWWNETAEERRGTAGVGNALEALVDTSRPGSSSSSRMAAVPADTMAANSSHGCRSGPTAGAIQVGDSVRWVEAVQEFELPAVPFPSRRLFDVAGEPCLRDLVRRHHDNLRQSSIGGMFPEDEAPFAALAARVADYVVEASGGPARFTPIHGNTCMRARHYPFTIDEKARETWLLCLWRAFDEANFPRVLRREYWDWMEAFSARMINRRTMRAQPARFPFEAMPVPGRA